MQASYCSQECMGQGKIRGDVASVPHSSNCPGPGVWNLHQKTLSMLYQAFSRQLFGDTSTVWFVIRGVNLFDDIDKTPMHPQYIPTTYTYGQCIAGAVRIYCGWLSPTIYTHPQYIHEQHIGRMHPQYIPTIYTCSPQYIRTHKIYIHNIYPQY